MKGTLLTSLNVYFHFCFPAIFDRILALEKLGAVFNQVAFPLQYTPRRFVIHPETNNLVLIETDHNAYTEATKAQRKQQMAEVRAQGIYHEVAIPLILVLIYSVNDAVMLAGKSFVNQSALYCSLLVKFRL